MEEVGRGDEVDKDGGSRHCTLDLVEPGREGG